MRAMLATFGSLVTLALAACGDRGGSIATTGTTDPAGTTDAAVITDAADTTPDTPEESVTFAVGTTDLHGILTLPASPGPHPAVVIASGSETESGTVQSGVSDAVFVDVAERLADVGYAALRYDTAGVGLSEGEVTLGDIAAKRDETVAALRWLRQRGEVRADEVGLWGSSQEAWTIGMAAADHPDEVAFVITVSGAGISVAEQQVWGIEAQSRAAGLSPDDVVRASVFGGLLVDWQLSVPHFEAENRELVERLGAGPWQEFLTLVYDSPTISADESLDRTIEILTSIREEPWADALRLDELYLPTLTTITPDQLDLVRETVERTLLVDPRDHLTRVQCPVLAFFGEDDDVQPTERSAALYDQYLDEAGNDDVTIVILPDVGHDIVVTTPGYRDRLETWLTERSADTN